MNWKMHAIIGFLTVLFFSVFIFRSTDIFFVLPLSLFGAASALLPDLDHPMSKGRQIMDKGIFAIALFISITQKCQNLACFNSPEAVSILLLNLFALSGCYFFIFTFLKPQHRGITHSLSFAILYGFVLYFIIGFSYAVAGGAGYLSHLLADSEVKIF